jgi:hypothetical protein
MISNSIFVLSILVLSVLPTLSRSVATLNAHIAVIVEGVLEWAIWPPSANISDTVQTGLLYSHNLNSSCYWPDINYTSRDIMVWSMAKHVENNNDVASNHGQWANNQKWS